MLQDEGLNLQTFGENIRSQKNVLPAKLSFTFEKNRTIFQIIRNYYGVKALKYMVKITLKSLNDLFQLVERQIKLETA